MKKTDLIVHTNSKSPISEAFRTLRTNIQFASSKKGIKVILITSPMMGDGKSLISSNLAVAFAQQGKKVLLIDADMRRGRIHKIFDMCQDNGLSNYLANYEFSRDSFVFESNIKNLYLIPNGTIPPNPSELLSSDRMRELLEDSKSVFDIIILDGPPCLAVTDGAILSRYVDATFLVVSHKRTTKEDIKGAKAAIENVGSKINGIVLNKLDITKNSYGYMKYYKDYGYYADEKRKVKRG